MDVALVCCFLFFMGAMIGYVLEFLFRNLISHNGPKLGFVINPGFCSGPYLPIYGIGLTVMCLISVYVSAGLGGELYPIDNPWYMNVIVVLGIGICMTVIEFVGGLILLKLFNIRLWDYTKSWGNVMGLICPLFSLIWMVLGIIYYFLIHPYIINSLLWLANHLAFSFFIGAFWGVFIIDLVMSFQRASIVKEFGNDHEVVVRYEELKALIQEKRAKNHEKPAFFNQVGKIDENIRKTLEERKDSIEIKANHVKEKKKKIEKAAKETGKKVEKAVANEKKQVEKKVKETKKQVSKAAKDTKKKVEKAVKTTKKKVDKKLK